MTMAVDTNVISTLWDRDPVVSRPAKTALDNAFRTWLFIAYA